MSDEKGRNLQVPVQGAETPTEKSLKLTQNDVIDLSGLSDNQVSELRLQHAKGLLSLQQKAQEMKIEIHKHVVSITMDKRLTIEVNEGDPEPLKSTATGGLWWLWVVGAAIVFFLFSRR